ncbi:hypothetical protein EAE99_006781 [Botrytis elliptica]|nr:hypothetical protein EAE99_006781 [Botrytis elliptica]
MAHRKHYRALGRLTGHHWRSLNKVHRFLVLGCMTISILTRHFISQSLSNSQFQSSLQQWLSDEGVGLSGQHRSSGTGVGESCSSV